jgi:hypothetical protein
MWEWASETRVVEAELESYRMQAAAQPQRIALLETRSSAAEIMRRR